MTSDFFIDSNILLYSISPFSPKAARAVELLRRQPTISVQVLNEYVNVSLRKLKLDWAVIQRGLAGARGLCRVVELSLATHERGVEIAMANQIGIYDANIIAAAELAGCDVLYTEDLNHGQTFGRVSIVNPFKGS